MQERAYRHCACAPFPYSPGRAGASFARLFSLRQHDLCNPLTVSHLPIYRLLVCKRRPFSLQYVAFCIAKGYVSENGLRSKAYCNVFYRQFATDMNLSKRQGRSATNVIFPSVSGTPVFRKRDENSSRCLPCYNSVQYKLNSRPSEKLNFDTPKCRFFNFFE